VARANRWCRTTEFESPFTVDRTRGNICQNHHSMQKVMVMALALRSPMAAGVALATAGAVLAGPAVISPPEVRVDMPDMHLTSAVLDTYRFIAQSAADNAQLVLAQGPLRPLMVAEEFLAGQPKTPLAFREAVQTATSGVRDQLVNTVPGQLALAVRELVAGDVDKATNTLLGIPVAVLRPVLSINSNLPYLAIGLIGPVISGIGAFVGALRDVIDAVKSGSARGVVDAILEGPAQIADGILNGGYGPDLSPNPTPGAVVLAGGIFTPGSTDGGKTVLPGPIATLQGHNSAGNAGSTDAPVAGGGTPLELRQHTTGFTRRTWQHKTASFAAQPSTSPIQANAASSELADHKNGPSDRASRASSRKSSGPDRHSDAAKKGDNSHAS
jgi:hypothetical protein